MADRYSPGTDRPSPTAQSGLTLIEMVVAIFVVGLILSALASVLTSVMSAIRDQEQQATASALAQQEIERLLSLTWDSAALYEQELPPTGSAWWDHLASDLVQGEPEYLPAYGSDLDERFAGVPRPVTPAAANLNDPAFEEDTLPEGIDPNGPVVVNGVEFTFYRYVTWVDRGDPANAAADAADTKRFTVVVEWTGLGRSGTITTSAERIPDLGEAAPSDAGVRVLSFRRSPDPSQLHPSELLAFGDDQFGRAMQPIELDVRLNRGVLDGRVTFQRVTDVELYEYHETYDEDGVLHVEEVPLDPPIVTYDPVEVSMTSVPESLDPNGGYRRWRLTIPTASYVFVDGINPFRFDAQDPLNDAVTSVASIRFQGSGIAGDYPGGSGLPAGGGGSEDDDEDLGELPDVGIVSVTLSEPFCVNTSEWQLRASHPVTVKVQVKGLRSSDGSVLASYEYQTNKTPGNQNPAYQEANETLTFTHGNPSLAHFELQLPRGDARFEPGSQVRVDVLAYRPSDEQNTTSTSNTVVVVTTCP